MRNILKPTWGWVIRSVFSAVGSSIVLGIILLVFGMSGPELVRLVWGSAPDLVASGWTRLAILLLGLSLLGLAGYLSHRSSSQQSYSRGTVIGDMHPKELFSYLCGEARWGEQFSNRTEWFRAVQVLIRDALYHKDSPIQVSGRRPGRWDDGQPRYPADIVPRSFWQEGDLNWIIILNGAYSGPVDAYDRVAKQTVEDVMFYRHQVEAMWKRRSKLRRLIRPARFEPFEIIPSTSAPWLEHAGPVSTDATSPLKFIDKHQEYDHFAGGMGTVELRAVVANESPSNETVRDVEMTLVRVRKLARPGESVHGQPYLHQLPRRLVSDRNTERDDLPPRRERAFRLCQKTTPEWPPHALSQFSLAPGSQGGDIQLDFGRYLLHVIASGLNTLPAEQTYLVDVTQTQIYRHLCTQDDLRDPKNIPVMHVTSSVSRVLDHNDWAKWDNTNRFKLWEAACLWTDEVPAMPLSIRAYVAFRKLEKAIEDKDLRVIQDDLRDVIADAYERVFHGRVSKAHPYWTVTRQELHTCAMNLGEKPRFLFPRERT